MACSKTSKYILTSVPRITYYCSFYNLSHLIIKTINHKFIFTQMSRRAFLSAINVDNVFGQRS